MIVLQVDRIVNGVACLLPVQGLVGGELLVNADDLPPGVKVGSTIGFRLQRVSVDPPAEKESSR